MKGGKTKMQEQIQQGKSDSSVLITRAAMEEELGDSYKRCWAYAFKYASDELDFDQQVEHLCREFELLKPQALWFVNGANAILFKQEARQSRQENQTKESLPKQEQRQLPDFSKLNNPKPKQEQRYISQVEMMSFLEEVEEMSHDSEFTHFWDELTSIKQKVLEQSCATEKDVLKIFRIRSTVERAKEETERFFDAYPISTDAWENGHFNTAGEVIYN